MLRTYIVIIEVSERSLIRNGFIIMIWNMKEEEEEEDCLNCLNTSSYAFMYLICNYNSFV